MKKINLNLEEVGKQIENSLKNKETVKKNVEFSSKGITLIALIITIIILLILAGVIIMTLTGEDSILNRASTAREENNKATATEEMNLKITNVEISKYAEEQRMPTLKELADNFCEDDDFQYVEETSKIASLPKVSNENPTSIYTKLKAYPYEFEINSSLQLASIDGIEIATTPSNPTNASNNYSTTEHVVGTWINGKTLYEKTINVGTLNNGWKQVNHSIDNIDKIVNGTGILFDSNNNYYVVPYLSDNSQYYVALNLDENSVSVYAGSAIYSSITDSYITIQYTKTID